MRECLRQRMRQSDVQSVRNHIVHLMVPELDDLDDLVDGGLGRQSDVLEADADLLCGLGLHADVHARVGACAGLDDDELGLEPGGLCLERCDALGDLCADLPGRRRS